MSFAYKNTTSVIPIGGIATLTGDAGGAISPTAGNINVAGNNGIVVAGNPFTSTLTISNGGTLTGNSGGAVVPTAGNINVVGSGGITVTGNPGTSTLTITGGSSFTWTEVTGTSQAMAVSSGYIANNAGLVTLTLPATAAVGSVIRVAGKGAGLWRIAQNAGQTMHFGASDTTTGVGGYLEALNRYDAIELVCITANSDFSVISVIGNLTIV